jgi:hypothetical protein
MLAAMVPPNERQVVRRYPEAYAITARPLAAAALGERLTPKAPN